MAKNVYGIIGIFREILVHKLAKYQYFSMRPSLFNYYYQITYYQKVTILYPKNLIIFTKSAISPFVLFVQSRSLKKHHV